MSKAIVNTLESLETGDSVDVRDIAKLSVGYQRQKTQIFQDVVRSYAEAGITVVSGSFEEGAVVTSANEGVWYQADGKVYSWFTDATITVPAGTTPQNFGGVNATAWVDRTDVTLRKEINIIQKRFACVADMIADTSLTVGQYVSAINLNSFEYYLISNTTDISNGLEVIALSNGLKAELLNSSEFSITKSKELYISNPVDLSDGESLNLSFNTIITTGTGAITLSGESHASDVRLTGDVSPGGSVHHAVFADESSDGSTVSNLYAENYTSAVYAKKVSNMHISNIRCASPVYHPSIVSGGYGVLLEGCDHSTVDGLNFTIDSSNGDLGRHAVYLSAPGSDTASGCNAIQVNNVNARYSNINNRDMWAINQRNGAFNSLSNITVDGANAGIAYNPTYGEISYSSLTNSIINIFKYNSTLPVYGISEQNITNAIDCVLRSNLITKVTPNDSSALYTGCYAAHLMGTNGFYGNAITAVPDHSNPLWLESVSHCLITNVVDKVISGDGTKSSFITFTGSNTDVKVTNILTTRPMFSGLDTVTDLTVDFRRKIDVTINAGVISYADSESCVSSIAISGSNVLITMKSHVTQKACDSAIVIANDINTSPLPIISGRSSKVLTVRGNTIAGVVIPPSSGSLNFSVILSC